MTTLKFEWLQEDGVRHQVSGKEVPEGIFYPVRPNLTDAEWRAEAMAAGAALWEMIGKRQVYLVGTTSGVWHALRTVPRGYGKRRRLWAQTAECGLVFSLSDSARERMGKTDVSKVTCLSCRKTVRERAEREIRYDGYSPEFEASLEAYDQAMLEESWRIQAEWHKPDDALREIKRGDRIRHRDYGLGTVIIASHIDVLVSFDARRDLPKRVNLSDITEIATGCVPLWAIPADLNYGLMGG